MRELARASLVPGKIELNQGKEQSCWQIVYPNKELERAVERYMSRHAGSMSWLRVHERSRRGTVWHCQLVAFAGEEEAVWEVVSAAIAEWNAEPDPRITVDA